MTWRMMLPLAGRTGVQTQDPFTALQRQMNRAFDDMFNVLPEPIASMPLRLDVKEDAAAYHITADLPGLNESEVDVTFRDGMLTIRGEKKVERDEKNDTWHIVERSTGSFLRQLSLPSTIDENKIEAKFDKGVLTIVLPKMANEQAQARKIEVKAG